MTPADPSAPPSPTAGQPAAKLWGGRFAEGTDALVEAFSESVSFDQRLWRQDIAGSTAHARMLGKVGVLKADDVEAIVNGLASIRAEIEAGRFAWQVALEDVHMNIESRLTAMIGDAGKRLHTARSRNDQVATDIRLYVRDAIDELVGPDPTRLLVQGGSQGGAIALAVAVYGMPAEMAGASFLYGAAFGLLGRAQAGPCLRVGHGGAGQRWLGRAGGQQQGDGAGPQPGPAAWRGGGGGADGGHGDG